MRTDGDRLYDTIFGTPKYRSVARLQSYMDRAVKLYPELRRKYQFKNIQIIFTDDPKTHAGQAWRASNTIEINLAYFARNNDEMLDQIIGHELCHIIAPLLYSEKGDGHTVAWKKVMTEMGFRPETYHNMEV